MVLERLLKNNVLIQYTLISFFLTLVAASVLSWQLSLQMRDQLIYFHGDFYRVYVRAINRNYSEILPLIHGDVDEEYIDEEVNHSDHYNVENADAWGHFESDLIQFPYVKQFRIVNSHSEVVWKYRSEDYIRKLDIWALEVDSFIKSLSKLK